MRRAIKAHLGSRQVPRVIYGAIIGLALVVGLEDHPPRPEVVVATILSTAVVVGLAVLYSEAIGSETRARRRIEGEDFGRIAGDVAAEAFGIGFPAVFVLAAASAMELETAFTVAKWSGLALIGLYGFWGPRLSGRRLPASSSKPSH